MNRCFGGKVALVTGASSGVGAGIARGLAAAGATVVVNYRRNREGAEGTAACIRAEDGTATIARADVGIEADVTAMFGCLRADHRKLDILVNNAGITLKKPLLESDSADWERIVGANLKGAFLCTRAAAPLMPRGSAVLNISSTHACTTTHNFGVYAASKGGLEALTRSMAIELAALGIRANAIRLGWIQVARDRVGPDDPAYERICARFPLGRPGEVADVVPTALHLCSDDAAWITGAVVVVDGGHGITLNTAFPHGHVAGGARGQ